MARIFNRGELKYVLLSVLDSLGEGHGYAIMQELQRRVGQEWRASPGAIYPALVTLEEGGLIGAVERDGLRIYSLTPTGADALHDWTDSPQWRDYSRRAGSHRHRATLGTALDRFQTGLPRRSPLDPQQAEEVASVLARARTRIEAILDQGELSG
jgi:DNA-binding PadR family transcriptional regulator